MSDIQLDSFYMDYPMSTWIMGGPANVQEWLAHNATKTLERMWGTGRPILMVPPGTHPNPRMCLTWLHGPSKGDEHGTHLFVIWFSDVDPTNPLDQALQHVEAQGGWDAHAKGYWI